jgi:hypothetical protein
MLMPCPIEGCIGKFDVKDTRYDVVITPEKDLPRVNEKPSLFCNVVKKDADDEATILATPESHHETDNEGPSPDIAKSILRGVKKEEDDDTTVFEPYPESDTKPDSCTSLFDQSIGRKRLYDTLTDAQGISSNMQQCIKQEGLAEGGIDNDSDEDSRFSIGFTDWGNQHHEIDRAVIDKVEYAEIRDQSDDIKINKEGDVKKKRAYGDRVLLARQSKDKRSGEKKGMLALGGGNISCCMWSADEKNDVSISKLPFDHLALTNKSYDYLNHSSLLFTIQDKIFNDKFKFRYCMGLSDHTNT